MSILDVMYLENRSKNASGISTGTPPLKVMAIKKIKLK
jgi:hypothetical protein